MGRVCGGCREPAGRSPQMGEKQQSFAARHVSWPDRQMWVLGWLRGDLGRVTSLSLSGGKRPLTGILSILVEISCEPAWHTAGTCWSLVAGRLPVEPPAAGAPACWMEDEAAAPSLVTQLASESPFLHLLCPLDKAVEVQSYIMKG